jgi:TolB-like protein/thioredoxin-like negative regulator of GroEL
MPEKGVNGPHAPASTRPLAPPLRRALLQRIESDASLGPSVGTGVLHAHAFRPGHCLNLAMSKQKKAVFISYAREDAAAARLIAEGLRNFGIEVWFDQNELRGGDAWDAHIHEQIRTCALFIPVISKQCQTRGEGYFRREWALADDRTRDMGRKRAFILPICIDETKAADADVPESFLRPHWAQLPGGLPTHGFVKRVGQLLEARVAATPTASAAENATSAVIPRALRKKLPEWIWVAAGVVVIAGSVGAYVAFNRAPAALPAPVEAKKEVAVSPAKAPAKSIAVLPLDNRSDLKEDEYFTDGIHDDLLTQISRIHDIKTISRTSVMAYRDTTKNIRTIGEELGVATILEGGVQRAGEQIRINVQLIDAATDAHLWAETYTREMTAENVFAIQSEIASAIAKALQAVLSPEQQKQLRKLPTQNIAALELLFKAGATNGTAEGAREAIEYLKQAIVLDPDFAAAHSALAASYLFQVWSEGLPNDEQVAKAEPHIRRALELDPEDSGIQVNWAGFNIRKGDNATAQAAIERAIELNPNNARAYAFGAWFQLWTMRNPAAAVDLARKAVELDPVSSGATGGLAEALLVAGRFQESESQLRDLIAKAPRYFDALRIFGNLQREAYNHYDEAIKAYREALSLDPENAFVSMHMAAAYTALGDRAGAAFWWNHALKQAPESRNTVFVRAMLHQVKDEDEQALAALREVKKGDDYFAEATGKLADGELKAGRPNQAIDSLIDALPALAEPGLVLNQDMINFAAPYARAQLGVGQRASAEAMIERIAAATPTLVRMGTFGFFDNDAKLYAAAGDHGRALAALRELVVDSGACSNQLGAGSEWDSLREDPEFKNLIAISEARLAEQRANLARMETAGELAPIPPLPGAAH